MIYGNGDTAESLVTYHVDSTFCILIPETLEVGTYPYYFSAHSLDLCDNEKIGISVYGISENGYITMHTNGGKQMVAEVIWTKGNVPVYEGQNIAVFTPTVSYSEDNRYPWTRLGYTYDWADNGKEYGLSESLIFSPTHPLTLSFTHSFTH